MIPTKQSLLSLEQLSQENTLVLNEEDLSPSQKPGFDIENYSALELVSDSSFIFRRPNVKVPMCVSGLLGSSGSCYAYGGSSRRISSGFYQRESDLTCGSPGSLYN